ncbi:MAG: hypothetical protein RLY20_1774 [Verrucomicrobiota bacterium]|jgi:hypothetical protein
MIIWGSKGKEVQAGSGSFFCPSCRADAPYTLMRVSKYFTLYFIPLFPTGTIGQYVRCFNCKHEYPDVILTCTREEILKAISPWTCAKCGNTNPLSQNACLKCDTPQPGVPPVLPR